MMSLLSSGTHIFLALLIFFGFNLVCSNCVLYNFHCFVGLRNLNDLLNWMVFVSGLLVVEPALLY